MERRIPRYIDRIEEMFEWEKTQELGQEEKEEKKVRPVKIVPLHLPIDHGYLPGQRKRTATDKSSNTKEG